MKRKIDEEGNVLATRPDGSTYPIGQAKRKPCSKPVSKIKRKKELIAQMKKEQAEIIKEAGQTENYVRLGLAEKRAVAPKIYFMNKLNVFATCQQLGITRKTFYDWRQSYPSFDRKLVEIEEGLIDTLEGVVSGTAIDYQDVDAAIKFLNAKAKNRGWGKVEGVQAGDVKIEIINVSPRPGLTTKEYSAPLPNKS